MSIPAIKIANYFLKLAEKKDKPVSPLKLQKLLYFAHGWYLAFERKPLLKERIEAWRHGPVVRSVYDEFRNFKNQPITRLAGTDDSDRTLLDSEIRQIGSFLNSVWEVYGTHSAYELTGLTHREGTPWRKVYDECGGLIPFGLVIPNKDIKIHFDKKHERAQSDD